MFLLISRLYNIADKLDGIDRIDLADRIDKVANEIKEAVYKPRFKRQIKGRGVARIKRKLYYTKNKYKIKVRTKKYRQKKRPMLTFRKRLKHFKRL